MTAPAVWQQTFPEPAPGGRLYAVHGLPGYPMITINDRHGEQIVMYSAVWRAGHAEIMITEHAAPDGNIADLYPVTVTVTG